MVVLGGDFQMPFYSRSRWGSLVLLGGFCLLFYLVSFTANAWFSLTMPRHQTLQLPIMFALGVGLAFGFSRATIKSAEWKIDALIFVMGTLIFWMLPRSVDWAAFDADFNRIMHVTMVVSGFLCVTALRGASVELRMAFLGMVAAMLLAVGFTLQTFDILLCSAFTISQQQETGLALLLIGGALLVAIVGVFIRSLGIHQANDGL